jgi:hypothetical protein
MQDPWKGNCTFEDSFMQTGVLDHQNIEAVRSSGNPSGPQSVSTGPRLSPQPEALRHESSDGTNGTQEYAQTAPEVETTTVVFLVGRAC